MKPLAIVTGASSGFGKSIAKKLAENGYDLILIARRKEHLEALRSELAAAFHTDIFIMDADVRDRKTLEKWEREIPEPWRRWEVLINNAGLAVGRESVEEADVDDWDRMIDTNVKGLLYATRTFVRLMMEKRKGTIINVGSIAGREAYPGGNVYSATKFAVDALTKNMRLDYLSYGLRVGQIAPGAAETEFSLVRFKGNEEKAKLVYKGYTPLSADDVADAVWFMVSRPYHVCINDMLIMPTAQANATQFNKSMNVQ